MKRFKVPIGGQKYTISLVRDDHKVFAGEDQYGCTLAYKNTIYFAKGYSQSALEDAYIHECLGHAAFAVSGANVMLAQNLKPGVDPFKFEEELVQKLTLAWHPFLTHHKFQFPKLGE